VIVEVMKETKITEQRMLNNCEYDFIPFTVVEMTKVREKNKKIVERLSYSEYSNKGLSYSYSSFIIPHHNSKQICFQQIK
jgi:hypothetical protein